MSQLIGQTIVVTGAGRGLGRALAQHLTQEGADVAVLGRGAEALEGTVALCGGKAAAFVGDLSVDEDVERVFGEIAARYGKIDALINNAAIIDWFRIADAPPSRMRRIVDANLLAPMLTAHFGVPLLRKAGRGDIINISSESVRNPYALMAAYVATKAGLEQLSRGLRMELKSENIRVTTLQVGVMDDPDRAFTMDPELIEPFMQQNAGAFVQSGGAMKFSTVAHAVVNLLTLPREASYELVELRPL